MVSTTTLLIENIQYVVVHVSLDGWCAYAETLAHPHQEGRRLDTCLSGAMRYRNSVQ